MLTIGPITVDPGILLAPMEDVSELPFRLICKELGADMLYTEFVNAEGLLREDPEGPRRTFNKLRFSPEERPLAIQLYGAASLSMERPPRSRLKRIPILSISIAVAGSAMWRCAVRGPGCCATYRR